MFQPFHRIGCGLALVAVALMPLTVRAASNQQVAATVLCANPQADAAVRTAFPPELPEIARLQGTSGTAYLKIDLTPEGALANASIIQSSGSNALDQAALTAVRESSFAPEIHDCAPVGGSYVYVVDFSK